MTRRQGAEPFHAVLLAGGSGTRFWPLSRSHRPKQFLALGGGEPLILETWRRLRTLVPRERVWVVAPRALSRAVRRHLPELRPGNLLAEPAPRDTAPAVALACASIARRDPGAIVGIFPTDHIIRDTGAFARSLRVAVRAARSGSLVCLGIPPDRPATGFGYLECSRPPRGLVAVEVERFVEKPDEVRARRFLRSGRFLWNAGMFVWRADRFLEELGRTAPGILRSVEGHLAGRKGAWSRAERRSVDYAVMEKASGVKVVALRAGWDDVGSWDAAARLREERRIVDRENVLLDSAGSVVFGGGRLVALLGTPGVVVVDTPGALLVASRERSQELRRVTEMLRTRGREDLL